MADQDDISGVYAPPRTRETLDLYSEQEKKIAQLQALLDFREQEMGKLGQALADAFGLENPGVYLRGAVDGLISRVKKAEQQLAEALRERERLEGENRKLREALVQYADPENWDLWFMIGGTRSKTEWVPGGMGFELANEALKEPTS